MQNYIITTKYEKYEITEKVVGLNRDLQNQNLNITRKCYEKLGLEYKADSLYTNEDLSNVKNIDIFTSLKENE